MDWRNDPAWTLASYDRVFYAGKKPPEKPTAAAELAQPDAWASLYEGRQLVAVWSRLDEAPR